MAPTRWQKHCTAIIATTALLALSLSPSLLASSALGAQEKPQTRQGFWISVGVGGGSLGCENCGDNRETGGTAQIALGGTLSPRFQLGASSNAWAKEVNGTDITMSSLTAIAKFYPWVARGFYLSGGLGVGRIAFKEGSVTLSEDGTSAILGLGYDIRVGKNFSITPFLNGVGASFDGNRSDFNQVGIGFTWH
jgi:hypothetical protein